MRILEITPYFPPHLGGLEKYVFSISKHLVKRGNKVYVLTSNLPKTKKKDVIDGIEVYRLNGIKVLGNIFMPMFLKEFKEIAKKVDIIFTHGYPFFMNYIVAVAKNLFFPNFPRMIFTFHGYRFYDNSLKRIIRRLRDIITLKFVMNNNHAIIALTHHDKKLIKKYFCPQGKKIFIIPNGVDVKEYNKSKLNSELINEIREKTHNHPIVLFIGRLSEEKRPEFLLYVAKKLFPSLKFFIFFIGDGPLRDRLIQKTEELELENNVFFLGYVQEQVKKAFLFTSRLLVLPSLFEGLPTVILEAMAAGKPIVASRIPGVTEIVKDGINGFLIDKNDLDKLTEKIKLLLEDQNLATKMGEEGRKIVVKYNWENLAMKIEYIIKQIL